MCCRLSSTVRYPAHQRNCATLTVTLCSVRGTFATITSPCPSWRACVASGRGNWCTMWPTRRYPLWTSRETSMNYCLSFSLSLSPPSLSLPTSSLLLSHYRYSIESNQLLRMELNWRSSYLMYFNSQSECDRVGVSLSCPTPCHAHRKFAVLDVSRQDEFSPLKNAEGAPSDTPTTCRDALMSLHYRQLIGSGGVVSVENGTPPRYLPANQIAHLDVMGVAYCYIIFNFN